MRRISTALQAFIYLATALIFLVVAFIFANTLIISIIERTGEIGTMRALGGEKSFVRSIFLSETLFLNVAASLVGIGVGLALVLAAGSGGLPLPEMVSQFLIGGGPLPMGSAAPLPDRLRGRGAGVDARHDLAHQARHPDHPAGRDEREVGRQP